MKELNTLQSLGLSVPESKVYLSLIKMGSSSIKEISEESKIPPNKLYAVLEGMKSKKVVTSLPVSPVKYSLLNPKSFLSGKTEEMEMELNDLKYGVENLIALSQSNEKSNFYESFLIIKGQNQIMEKLIEETFKAKKEILSSHSSWKIHKNSLFSIKDAIKRGVKIKMIGRIDDSVKDKVKLWRELGVDIVGLNDKFLNNPLRFSIFDEAKVRITIGSPEIGRREDYLTFWVESVAFARIMKKTFENLWKDSDKLA